MSGCLICGKELPIDMTCIVITEGKNKYRSVCCKHEGTQELKDLIIENLKEICGDSVACKGECGEKCDLWIEHQLSKINKLVPKITDIECDESYCIYAGIPVDDEVKAVYEEFGIRDKEFEREIEDGKVNLNTIGFIYGKWFDSQEGYLNEER